MGRILSAMLLLLLLLHTAYSVKIGISRVNIDFASTTTTTTTHMPTDYAETTTTTTADLEEISATSDTTEADIESTTAAIIRTTTTAKPNFTIAIFPPRLRTTKSPKITTTTTTVATTSTPSPPSTKSTEVINTTTNSSQIPDDTNTIGGSATSGVYYCDCDMLLDACDVNCCCDRDCMPEALNVFNCKAHTQKPQLKNRLEDFQYQHGLPSCKVNDGWLCVFRTNTRKEREKPPEIDLDLNHYFKWSTPIWSTDDEQHFGDDLNHYKYGQHLQFLDMKTMTLKRLDLPLTFQPPHCQIKETVKFLKSYKTNCLLNTIEEVQLNTKNTLKFIQNNKLLLKPINEAIEPEQITKVLSEFKLKICTKELCEIVPLNNNTALEQRLKACHATEIKFLLLHNYTQLLGGLVVFDSSGSSTPNDSDELWQSYQLEYIYKNTTTLHESEELNVTAYSDEHAIKLTSGPLGYLQGKPIIIARFIANNQSATLSHTNQVLDYFHVNNTKSPINHTISLFTTQREFCVHETATQANVINYGISTLKQCQLRFSRERVSHISQNARNFTEICIQLQTEITKQFFSANIYEFGVNFPELFVSQLGRPKNRSDKWTPLKVENQNFAPISGEFNAQAQSFSCRNMLLNIAYEFLVGHFPEAGIMQQAMVKQATLLFGERNDLEFELDEVIEVPLMVSVMFFDYSKDVYNSGITYYSGSLIWTTFMLNAMLFYQQASV